MSKVVLYTNEMFFNEKHAAKFIKENTKQTDEIYILDIESQNILYELVKKLNYKINHFPSLYKKLGPKGEEAIYHFICSQTSKSLFIIGYDASLPRLMSVAAEYHSKENILFKII